MKPENVITTYESVAAAWAKTRYKGLMERRWLDRFLSLAPRGDGAVNVLDLGCGAGQPIASYLSDRGAHVTGVDAAAAMTALFAENLPGVRVLQADMRGLDLQEHFAGIIAWNSFFHLSADDQRAMFPVFAAHAAPNAALMFTSGHLAGEAIGHAADAPIYHASLDPDEYRDLLKSNGFRVVRHIAQDPDCGDHTVWLARFTGG